MKVTNLDLATHTLMLYCPSLLVFIVTHASGLLSDFRGLTCSLTAIRRMSGCGTLEHRSQYGPVAYVTVNTSQGGQ